MTRFPSRIVVPVHLCLALCAAPSHAAEFIGVGDADFGVPGDLADGDLRLWSQRRIGEPHALRVVSAIAGASAARFEIRPDDRRISDGYRAELRDPYVASPGEEVWYRFRTLIPAEFPFTQPHSVVLAQWHDRKSAKRPAARPPLAVRMVDGELRITLWNDEVLARQGLEGNGRFLHRSMWPVCGRWLDFVFRVKWAAGGGGRVQVWLDQAPIVDYSGPVGYSEDEHGPYFKLGLYTVHEFEQPMYVYHTGYVRTADGAGLIGPAAGSPRGVAACAP